MRCLLFTGVLVFGCAAAPEKSSAPTALTASSPAPAAALAKPRGLMASICKEPTYRAPKLAGAVPRKLAQGSFNFLEGALWWAEGRALLFSDMQPAAGPEGIQPSAVRH